METTLTDDGDFKSPSPQELKDLLKALKLLQQNSNKTTSKRKVSPFVQYFGLFVYHSLYFKASQMANDMSSTRSVSSLTSGATSAADSPPDSLCNEVSTFKIVSVFVKALVDLFH